MQIRTTIPLILLHSGNSEQWRNGCYVVTYERNISCSRWCVLRKGRLSCHLESNGWYRTSLTEGSLILPHLQKKAEVQLLSLFFWCPYCNIHSNATFVRCQQWAIQKPLLCPSISLLSIVGPILIFGCRGKQTSSNWINNTKKMSSARDHS